LHWYSPTRIRVPLRDPENPYSGGCISYIPTGPNGIHTRISRSFRLVLYTFSLYKNYVLFRPTNYDYSTSVPLTGITRILARIPVISYSRYSSTQNTFCTPSTPAPERPGASPQVSHGYPLAVARSHTAWTYPLSCTRTYPAQSYPFPQVRGLWITNRDKSEFKHLTGRRRI